MKTSKVKTVSGEFLPKVKLASAEKVLRDIARRNGEVIRKRRSPVLKDQLGDGYAVIEAQSNVLLSGGQTHDGCDFSLADVAGRYQEDDKNTPWQRTVIKAILADSVAV